jgi:hypothetical protein
MVLRHDMEVILFLSFQQKVSLIYQELTKIKNLNYNT